jgi:hypothetical protein
MLIYEQETDLGGFTFREIRRLNTGGHQTSIITTHPTIETPIVAGRMFGRWCQENFFKYLIHDYDFDKMITFGIETIDPNKQVVNPEYRKVNYKLKKLREKIQRLESKFYPLVQQAMDETLDDLPEITNKQIEYKTLLDQHRVQESDLLEKRSCLEPRITLNQMPEQIRYNKLKTESKLLMNVIKMICYRAESTVASLITPYFARAEDEKHMLIKQIIACNADLIPDYKENKLTVTLHSLSANRYNVAANILAELLTETETLFPGTNFRMEFKTAELSNCVE